MGIVPPLEDGISVSTRENGEDTSSLGNSINPDITCSVIWEWVGNAEECEIFSPGTSKDEGSFELRRTPPLLGKIAKLSDMLIAVVPVCVLLTHFCFNVRLFSQVCFICF